jgi:hypothetical protein
MTSLGFSEYAESNNDSSRTGNGNGNGKIYNRRNGGGGGGGGSSNRTLKIPRTNDTERGLLQSPNGGAITGISNENGNNSGVIQQAGKKMKQIKDYIESIHRKGGEDSEEDGDGEDSPSILPSYPAQGMGVYATNVSHSGIIRGADTLSSNTPSSAQVVRKTTQMNSLNPTTSYSSTLLEGMADSVGGMTTAPPSLYFEKLTGIAGAPKKDGQNGKSEPFSTNAYASQYYEQFVPYAESLANQLAAGAGGGSGSGGSMSGTNAALIEKLNYIIHMLEDKKDEKTGHVVEELVLYCFLGVFIIFIVDTFTRAASGGGGGAGRGSGAGGGGFGMFGGRRSFTSYRR